MIVTESNEGTSLFILVGGKGERLSSVTKGLPKPLVDIDGRPFIDYVIKNLKGFKIYLIASDLTYEHFKRYGYTDSKKSGVRNLLNEGECCGTGGFMCKLGPDFLEDSFYVMNGDSYFTGDLNVDVDKSTVFVAEEDVTDDVGYVKGQNGKVESFVEKDPNVSGKQLVNLGLYKFYKKDILTPMRLPISMEYDILPRIPELEYKVLNTVRFDIGTPERLEKFKTWQHT